MAKLKGNTIAVYNASGVTLSDGDETGLFVDVNGNTKVTQATVLDSTNDAISAYEKGWTPINLTASGQLLAAPGQIKGFYVNSTSSGTIVLRDALTATTPVISGTITPAVGWHEFPAGLSTGGYATLANTIDVTFFVRSGTKA
jgi:S-formylglutathione hydrolase FrmB